MKERCGNCVWEDDGFCDIKLKDVEEDDSPCNSWEEKGNAAVYDRKQR